MTPIFTSLGKQVLASGDHYADAADDTAAAFIAEACNALSAGRFAATRPSTPADLRPASDAGVMA